MNINENYKNVQDSYLFSKIAHKVDEYKKENPNANIIKMGIGDVTLPLPNVCVEAIKKAADEMGTKEGFHGYGPEQGYEFLRKAIQGYYAEIGVSLQTDEVFVSDGAKSDVGNIIDLFDKDNVVMVPDPVYPVYVDTNIMSGRKIVYANANESNKFIPLPEEGIKADIIYICSPNNPTGAVYTKDDLKKWIGYAKKNNAVILFDAAYESFVTDSSLPRSIFEIDGAKECAIEFCSLSKTAGFTGTRCGYTVVPKELIYGDMSLNKMWLRRQTTKFNGVSYIVQRAAEAIFTQEGRKEINKNLDVYRNNAKIISDTLDKLGIWYVGGKHSPYIWFKCPNGMESWSYFDYLLTELNIVGTPGAGFGKNGNNFFRLTAFGGTEETKEAMDRLIAASR